MLSPGSSVRICMCISDLIFIRSSAIFLCMWCCRTSAWPADITPDHNASLARLHGGHLHRWMVYLIIQSPHPTAVPYFGLSALRFLVEFTHNWMTYIHNFELNMLILWRVLNHDSSLLGKMKTSFFYVSLCICCGNIRDVLITQVIHTHVTLMTGWTVVFILWIISLITISQ